MPDGDNPRKVTEIFTLTRMCRIQCAQSYPSVARSTHAKYSVLDCSVHSPIDSALLLSMHCLSYSPTPILLLSHFEPHVVHSELLSRCNVLVPSDFIQSHKAFKCAEVLTNPSNSSSLHALMTMQRQDCELVSVGLVFPTCATRSKRH